MDHASTTSAISSDAKRWFALAVASVTVGGLMAVVLVIGRIPGLAPLMIKDVELARRALVVHVDLTLGVWFFAFLAGMFCMQTGRDKSPTASIGWLISTIGVLLFSACMFIDTATPMLSNYVPALDHPLFLVGISMFAGGLILTFLGPRMWSLKSQLAMPASAVPVVRLGAFAFIVAIATFGITYVTMHDYPLPVQHYERLFWGGGHVLQFANIFGMLTAWSLLLRRVTGRLPLAGKTPWILAILLFAPVILAPVWAAENANPTYFTSLMRWGIFPVVSFMILINIWHIIMCKPSKAVRQSEAFNGWIVSSVMVVIGFLLGAFISESTTLIPAHYHVSIGAVTTVYMALMLVLLEDLRAPIRTARGRLLARWQPVIFGVGQTMFAAGLALAGTWGKAERKVYGQQQAHYGAEENIGLWIMGVGGAIAVVAGILWVVIVIRALLHAKKHGPSGPLTSNSV
ncbi:MAG: heme-copper oxidase family protein [Planctomycetota bacterium]|jgi:hypothetical protein